MWSGEREIAFQTRYGGGDWVTGTQIREVDKRRWDAMIKQGGMPARDGER